MLRRGQRSTELIHIADWYATYATLAGVRDITDPQAKVYNLPPLDSISCADMIFTENHPCRLEIPIGDSSSIGVDQDGLTLVGSLIRGPYKLLLGPRVKAFNIDQDMTTGPFYPNATRNLHLNPFLRVCNRDPFDGGCLYNVYDDPSESSNLASQYPDIFVDMLARIDELQLGVFSPSRGHQSPLACRAALGRHNYWGPFAPSVTSPERQ